MDSPLGTLLLTGFQPFRGRSVNGSSTLAEALHGKVIRDYVIESRVFAVQWEGLRESLDRAVAETGADMILGLGEGEKEYPCFENFALNEASGPDESGREPPGGMVHPHDPPVRKATMECERSWFAGLSTPVARSENAGTFLCNRLFYLALSMHSGRVGFLHVPIQGNRSSSDYLSPLVPILYRLISKNVAALDR